MPTLTTNKKTPKKTKIRNTEYYNCQEIQDRLYQQSKERKSIPKPNRDNIQQREYTTSL